MAYHSDVLEDEGIIHTVMSGEVTPAEARSLLAMREATDRATGVCRHLIDMRAVTSAPLPTNELEDLAHCSALLFGARARLTVFRTAIVADDAAFAALRAYEFLAACQGLMVRTFRDPVEAREWLGRAAATD